MELKTVCNPGNMCRTLWDMMNLVPKNLFTVQFESRVSESGKRGGNRVLK